MTSPSLLQARMESQPPLNQVYKLWFYKPERNPKLQVLPLGLCSFLSIVYKKLTSHKGIKYTRGRSKGGSAMPFEFGREVYKIGGGQ